MTQAGEILPSITDVFQKGFDECISRNKHRREPYYILVTANWYANHTQLRMNFAPMDFKPPVMLNTMLWRVNNKNGSLKQIWVLPMDAPLDPSIPLGEVDEGLYKIAKHLPLFYS